MFDTESYLEINAINNIVGCQLSATEKYNIVMPEKYCRNVVDKSNGS